MTERTVSQLSKLLDAERRALLSGDLEAVAAMTAEKEALAAGFESSNARDLQALSSALLRNGTLLEAAKEGVSTVLTTLRQQRAARNSLSSYDSSGNPTKIAQPERGTERRF